MERTVTWQGVDYRIALTKQQSGGAIGMFVSTDQPGYGPPRHIHDDADETFYVLTGEVDFWMDGEISTAQAGDVVFIPRGREHTFRVAGTLAARMLTIMTPGGFETFFADVAQEGLTIPDDMKRIAEIGAGYNLRFTGPPLGHE
ncbi:cupin domain-containing protein [Shimia biformata]|uniref:cupin domain-containing protein n=1 Tax=Shimia biformata TaxID=1294299 RepID=UPI0019509C39|nr:cupin domain-containing protein [Shimia biformata]